MMFHTVYNSFEEKENGRDYIGKHSSADTPYDSYLGSFSDNSFSPTGKIILGYSKTPDGAIWLEMQWQRVFRVAEDPQFANLVYQTSDKFDTTGLEWSEDSRKRQSRSQREAQNRPEVKEKKSKNITKAMNRPSVKEKHRKKMQEIGKNQEVQNKKSASRKASGKNPNLTESWKEKQRIAQSVAQNRPETKRLKSEKIKKRMQDPDVKLKLKSRESSGTKGMKWYTNGRESGMFSPGNEPAEWKIGRIDPRKNIH